MTIDVAGRWCIWRVHCEGPFRPCRFIPIVLKNLLLCYFLCIYNLDTYGLLTIEVHIMPTVPGT